MTVASSVQTVNIRPGVSVLSVLQHLNYKPWYAVAEFVDNSLQSFLASRDTIRAIDGPGAKLHVTIEIESAGSGRLVVRDNAAGIHETDYVRAFRPAEVPLDQTGLSEFGMGMKSAACWFARRWSVRSKALGESVERTVSFDIETIVRDGIEVLDVRSIEAPPSTHYTEITLSGLHNKLATSTITKIKKHLASIYRVFIRGGDLELHFSRDGNEEALTYPEPAILTASYFETPTEPPRLWRKDIALDFGNGLGAYGFAALRETGSTSEAGFALFRRGRLIQGSADEGYRPEEIFGRSNSYTYQRLFGELHLDGFKVSHTKDGFQWGGDEEVFLDLLKEQLNDGPLPLLSQAEGYRKLPKREEMVSGAEIATRRTGQALERDVPRVLERQMSTSPKVEAPPVLPPASALAKHVINVTFLGHQWEITLEATDDPSVGDWVSVFDHSATGDGNSATNRVGVRISLAHPFMVRFGGTASWDIEPLQRVAAAIGLAEVAARRQGVRQAGAVRHNINDLLRNALAEA